MPHVVLEGPIDLGRVVREFQPLAARDDAGIRRTGDLFLNASGQRVLIEATVVAAGQSQNFYISLGHQAKGADAPATVVRLEGRTDPVKNGGIRLLLGEVAHQLRELFPGTRIRSTNLTQLP